MKSLALIIAAFLIASCDRTQNDDWLMPGGWSGQIKAAEDCRKAGADCADGYNVIGSPRN